MDEFTVRVLRVVFGLLIGAPIGVWFAMRSLRRHIDERTRSLLL